MMLRSPAVRPSGVESRYAEYALPLMMALGAAGFVVLVWRKGLPAAAPELTP